MEQDDDKQFLLLLSSGDHAAFEILFTKYRTGLKQYIAFTTKSDAAAEDLVQEIFIKIWILRKQMAVIKSFRAYLFHVGRNAAYDYLRSFAVQRNYRSQFKPKERISQVEAYYFAYEIEHYIRLLVRRMPKQRHMVFQMSRCDGMNYKEIARELHISNKTVANHLHLALREIRFALKVLSPDF